MTTSFAFFIPSWKALEGMQKAREGSLLTSEGTVYSSFCLPSKLEGNGKAR
jgi:hypothetical protein